MMVVMIQKVVALATRSCCDCVCARFVRQWKLQEPGTFGKDDNFSHSKKPFLSVVHAHPLSSHSSASRTNASGAQGSASSHTLTRPSSRSRAIRLAPSEPTMAAQHEEADVSATVKLCGAQFQSVCVHRVSKCVDQVVDSHALERMRVAACLRDKKPQ